MAAAPITEGFTHMISYSEPLHLIHSDSGSGSRALEFVHSCLSSVTDGIVRTVQQPP